MTGVMVFVWLMAFVIAVLWVLMPFAIFGTKPLLRQLLAEQKRTNRLLEENARRADRPTDVILVSSRKADPLPS